MKGQLSTRTVKIAQTDLYGKGAFIKGSKLRDHTKPCRTGDHIRVDKGREYYEWLNESGEITGLDDKETFDRLMEQESLIESSI